VTFTRICILLSLIVAPCSFSGEAISQPTKIDSANRQFEVGKFAEAGGVYVRIADQNPKAYSAILRLGSIALLSNRLADAQKWLEEWKRR
jgi:hypothetical protein